MAELEEMRAKFNDQIFVLKSKKGKNSQLFTREEYYAFLARVKENKRKSSRKLPEEYQRLARYDIINIGNVERLIVPVKRKNQPIMFYTFLEENFHIINDIHITLGHGGRNKMMREIKTRYKNITIQIVMIYLNLCEPCKKKIGFPKKGTLPKPTKSNNSISRCQVDLIDLQSQSDDDYKFIMVYQDHQTKFVQLRALKTNGAEETAHHLLDIFTIFGAPCILQSDNGRDFEKKIIGKITEMWEELKIIQGKPRQSQCSVDVIKNMLTTYLEQNNTKKWSEALKFIQFMKNRTHHSGIGRSPYEALLGDKPKVGLKSHYPKEALSEITTEEELEEMLKEQNSNDTEFETITPKEEKDSENIGKVKLEVFDVQFRETTPEEIDDNESTANVKMEVDDDDFDEPIQEYEDNEVDGTIKMEMYDSSEEL